MSKKLVVIIGITGNQGGSVANTFLQHSSQWRIRGLTRDTSSSASRDLAAKGIEMVQADLHDPSTLLPAFKGANLIFSVTDFWKPFFNPANQSAAEESGKSIGRLAYELEYEQGKNIVDAAAHPDVFATLDKQVGLIASTLSSARECSKGKYKQLWHFDSKADIFPKYVEEKYPELAKRTSYLQTGFFTSSWQLAGPMYLGKVGQDSHQCVAEPSRLGLPRCSKCVSNATDFEQTSSGSYVQRFAAPADAVCPQLAVNNDTGNFAFALTQLPPKTKLMAAGSWCTWPEWIATWAKVVGVSAKYEQVGIEEYVKMFGPDFGQELGEMWEYSGDPGYDGGDKKVLRIDDLRKVGSFLSPKSSDVDSNSRKASTSLLPALSSISATQISARYCKRNQMLSSTLPARLFSQLSLAQVFAVRLGIRVLLAVQLASRSRGSLYVAIQYGEAFTHTFLPFRFIRIYPVVQAHDLALGVFFSRTCLACPLIFCLSICDIVEFNFISLPRCAQAIFVYAHEHVQWGSIFPVMHLFPNICFLSAALTII